MFDPRSYYHYLEIPLLSLHKGCNLAEKVMVIGFVPQICKLFFVFVLVFFLVFNMLENKYEAGLNLIVFSVMTVLF